MAVNKILNNINFSQIKWLFIWCMGEEATAVLNIISQDQVTTATVGCLEPTYNISSKQQSMEFQMA